MKIKAIALCLLGLTIAYAPTETITAETLINSNLYPKAMVVTEIDLAQDEVICTDPNGDEWVFEGVEDWCQGDLCAAIMYDNGTVSIYDDEIVMTRYNGNVNQ